MLLWWRSGTPGAREKGAGEQVKGTLRDLKPQSYHKNQGGQEGYWKERNQRRVREENLRLKREMRSHQPPGLGARGQKDLRIQVGEFRSLPGIPPASRKKNLCLRAGGQHVESSSEASIGEQLKESTVDDGEETGTSGRSRQRKS